MLVWLLRLIYCSTFPTGCKVLGHHDIQPWVQGHIRPTVQLMSCCYGLIFTSTVQYSVFIQFFSISNNQFNPEEMVEELKIKVATNFLDQLID